VVVKICDTGDDIPYYTNNNVTRPDTTTHDTTLATSGTDSIRESHGDVASCIDDVGDNAVHCHSVM